ncbi:MAG TPA: DUF1614 domain-containing protein, partial [archaeon]|nr:DUF1614 domain-containing protein [archaeon]
MAERLIYLPISRLLLALFIAILIAAVIFIFLIFGIETAFSRLGIGTIGVVLIITSSLVGSAINIPITKMKAKVPMVTVDFVRGFGVVYPIPIIEQGVTETIVAVNLGGAIVPTAVSIYLILRIPSLIIPATAGTLIVALLVYSIARPVSGVGITTPLFVPPILAAIVAYLLNAATHLGAVAYIAYIAGTLGTLLGADLFNLKVIPKLGAPVASIG